MFPPFSGRRRVLIASACAAAWPALGLAASGPGVLTVAAFPLLDEIIKTALPRWKQMHPGVELRLKVGNNREELVTMLQLLRGEAPAVPVPAPQMVLRESTQPPP